MGNASMEVILIINACAIYSAVFVATDGCETEWKNIIIFYYIVIVIAILIFITLYFHNFRTSVWRAAFAAESSNCVVKMKSVARKSKFKNRGSLLKSYGVPIFFLRNIYIIGFRAIHKLHDNIDIAKCHMKRRGQKSAQICQV